MRICQDHDVRGLEIGIVYVASGAAEGECPICDIIKEKDTEIDNLKQQIDTLEDQIANSQE